jgi:hypothetical protein
MVAFAPTQHECNVTETPVKGTCAAILRHEEDREKIAALNRIQDQQLRVRNEMENSQWKDVGREFELLLRLVDELGIRFRRQLASYVKLLDDLDTELRVTVCDKKSIRAMGKSNAGAFQVLKSQVETALENHRDIIDECKEEAAISSKEKIFSDDCKEGMKDEMKSSGQKKKKERQTTEGGKSARARARERARARALGQDECRIESRPTAFRQDFAAYSQEQKRRAESRALSKVPRRLEDLPESERKQWTVQRN